MDIDAVRAGNVTTKPKRNVYRQMKMEVFLRTVGRTVVLYVADSAVSFIIWRFRN